MNPAPAIKLSQGEATVTETPKFDLESYISNYIVLAVEALKAAVVEAKAGINIDRYVAAVAALQPHLKPGDRDGVEDAAWIEEKTKQNQAETNRLEAELNGYKNNLIKESIRMGNEEIGSHHHAMGDLASATKAYGRMRDYCTRPIHVASMSFRLVEVAIDRQDWLAVQSSIHKIRNLQLVSDDQAITQAKTHAAMGLCLMHMHDYRDAALSFLATTPTLGDRYHEVLTSNDVAVYGGLCALASMNREELQSLVLNNSTFRAFLELEPHIRRAINLFCAAKYSQCLEILQSYRADYFLDLHLQRHVPGLYDSIRTKSIVQYFAPFSRVTLESMAKTFSAPSFMNAQPVIEGRSNGNDSNNSSSQAPPQPTASSSPSPRPAPPPSIEDELAELISSGTLKAKIDLEHRVLVADQVDLRHQVHQETLDSLDRFKREAHLKLMRMEFLNAGMTIKSPWSSTTGTGTDTVTEMGMGTGMRMGSKDRLGGGSGVDGDLDLGRSGGDAHADADGDGDGDVGSHLYYQQ